MFIHHYVLKSYFITEGGRGKLALSLHCKERESQSTFDVVPEAVHIYMGANLAITIDRCRVMCLIQNQTSIQTLPLSVLPFGLT